MKYLRYFARPGAVLLSLVTIGSLITWTITAAPWSTAPFEEKASFSMGVIIAILVSFATFGWLWRIALPFLVIGFWAVMGFTPKQSSLFLFLYTYILLYAWLRIITAATYKLWLLGGTSEANINATPN